MRQTLTLKQKINKSLRLAKFLYYTGTTKIYHNGDGLGFIWRWYHPLTWVLAPLFILITILLYGFLKSWNRRENLGLRIDPYFTKNNIDPFNQ